MDLTLHTGCMPHANLATQIEAAKGAGFDGIELSISKLERYLGSGLTVDDLVSSLGPLRVTMLDVLMPIERRDAQFRAALRQTCERMAAVAPALGCRWLQVVALDEFGTTDWRTIQRTLVTSLRELADAAAPHGVMLALEPVVFSPFHRLDQALEVVADVGVDRVGLVLDTWHLWTSQVAWDEVASVEPALIAAVHISDSGERTDRAWRDQDRWPLPGSGILPLREATAAILTSGYDGVWGVEIVSDIYAEWHPFRLATELFGRVRHLLGTGAGSASMP